MVPIAFLLLFSITFRQAVIKCDSVDDKIIVTDDNFGEMYITSMSMHPDFSSTALRFTPSISLSGGPNRVRYNARTQQLFFTIQRRKTVANSNIDGSEAAEVINTHDRSQALTLDEDNGRVYWNSYKSGTSTSFTVGCTEYDGTSTNEFEVLSGAGRIGNIVLDKENQVLYFTNYLSDDAGVWRVNLDGSGQRRLASSLDSSGVAYRPTELVFDQSENTLIWSDTADDNEVLEVIETKGINRRILHTFDYDANIDDMVLYYEYVYMIADGISPEILRMPKDGSSSPAFVTTSASWSFLAGIAIIFFPPCVTDTLFQTTSSTGEILLTWTPDLTPGSQCNADEYQVSYQPYDLQICSVTATGASTTLDWQSSSMATISDVHSDTVYQITLSSRNLPADGQDSVFGNSVYTVEPCIANLVLIENANKQVEVQWSATTCECKASEYQITYFARDYCDVGTSGTLSWETQTRTALPISGALSHLEVTVKPRKVIGMRLSIGRSFVVSRDDITAVPTGPPVNVTPFSASANSFEVIWEDVPCSDSGGITQRYSYELVSQFGITSDEIPLKSATFVNLRCDTDYSFRVAAITEKGTGPFSNRIIIRTLISEEPFASELNFTSTSTQAEIFWIPAECPPTTFDVKYAMTLRDQCEEVSVSNPTNHGLVSDSSAVLNNLLSYSTYTVSITGIGSSGVSVQKTVEVTTQESVPTGTPVAVELIVTNPSSLTFAWKIPLCTSRNGNVTYHFELHDIQQFNVISQRTSETSAVLSPLNTNTYYVFRVSAVTSAGIGPFSDSVQAKTLTYEQCTSSYCQNGGLCRVDTVTEFVSCSCANGYSGARCEIAMVTTAAPPPPQPTTMTTQSGKKGIGAVGISAIAISVTVGLFATIVAVGWFLKLLQRGAAGATMASTARAQATEIPLQNMHYPQF